MKVCTRVDICFLYDVMMCQLSLVPRHFPPPVFDRLQYAKRYILQAIKNWRREWPGDEASTNLGLEMKQKIEFDRLS